MVNWQVWSIRDALVVNREDVRREDGGGSMEIQWNYQWLLVNGRLSILEHP